jgi:RNA polymerase sigma-70 factor (ECF subfamily)
MCRPAEILPLRKKMTSPGNSTNKSPGREPNAALVMPDDAELLRRIARGDRAAFDALVARHARYLHGVAHALVGNSADAEDLVQETLIAVLNGKFRGESSVRTWMVRILVNRAGMLKRSRRRKGPHVAMDDAPPMQTASGVAGMDAKLDLSAMLAALSPEHRAVIVLRELEQMSYEEMADALGIPRGTVESRLHRAREELRKRFKGYL